MYEQYKKLAKNEENIFFVGILANYKYFNMEAILNSLTFFKNVIQNIHYIIFLFIGVLNEKRCK